MPVITADQAAGYQKDMYAINRVTKSQEMEMTKHDKVFKTVTHEQGLGDKETQFLDLGRFQQRTGELETIDMEGLTQGWTSQTGYKFFDLGIAFSFEAIERVVKSKVEDLLNDVAETATKSEIYTKEAYAANAFNNGGDLAGHAVFNGSFLSNSQSSGDLPYDSVPFFNLSNNTRTSKGGATYYNSFAGYSLDYDNFEELYTHFISVLNRTERDEVFHHRPDTLLIDPADWATADILLKTSGDNSSKPFSSVNDRNPLVGKIKNVWDWDYLNDSSAFYIGKANDDKMQFINAKPAEIRFFRDETNRAYCITWVAGWSLWFKAEFWKNWVRGGGSAS